MLLLYRTRSYGIFLQAAHLYDAIITEMTNLHFVHSQDEYAVLDAIGKRKIDLARSKRLRVAWDKAVEAVTGNSVKDND